MPNAKLGAKVDRYSFFVRLLPPLLHTGLARRTNISITLKISRQGFLSEMAFYEKVIKVKADVAAYLINCFPSA